MRSYLRLQIRSLPAVMIAFSLAVFIPAAGMAGPVLTIDADAQFRFAESLFTQEKYPQAIDEYHRFIHFFPNDGRTGTARFKIAHAHMQLHRFESAIASFRDIIARDPAGDIALRSGFMISDCYAKLKDPASAAATLENIAAQSADPAIRDEAWYRMGWIYIESDALDKARRPFENISPANRNRFNVESLFSALDREPLIEKKNPALAGVLSILPGAGYLYDERYRDAVIAFIVNGAMIFATYAAIDNDNPALAGLLSFAELGFYTANIYGATAGAHKYNRKKRQDFIENLTQNIKVRISSTPSRNGAVVMLRYDF